ncbi:MAG: phosphatase PAP2 family protein [Candidatus Methanoperedens sp.]
MALEPFQFLFSENFNIYLQSFGNPFFDNLFKAITTIGSEPTYIFLASLIFWCYNKKTGIRVMYVILFSAFAAILAKNLFGMPRPPDYLHKIEENEFGFPSGHAQVSSGFWGYIGARTKNKWLIVAGTIAIFSISLSRIYLGVHYAGDVMGGIIFGLLIAIISFKAESGIINKIEKLSRSSKYLVAVILPVLLVTIAAMQESLLKEQVEIGLVMGGIGVGCLLENERVRFEDAKNNKQRMKRAIIGVAVLGIIYLISSLLFLINPNFVFFKYAALGFASTYIAPWAFTKMEI